MSLSRSRCPLSIVRPHEPWLLLLRPGVQLSPSPPEMQGWVIPIRGVALRLVVGGGGEGIAWIGVLHHPLMGVAVG